MVDSRRVMVARARPRASRSRAKHSMSARRALNRRTWCCWHQGTVVERNLGITFGLVVRAMGISKTVAGGISSLRQGEVSQFTVVLEDARRHAIDRMIENAKLLGANAVIAMRFDSSEIGKARAEVVAYGSAVVVRPPAGV